MKLSERAVFYALLERSDNADCSIPPRMTPSLQQLAEACCCWKSTAVRALDHLEHHAWITRDRVKKPGRGHKTRYKLLPGYPCPPDCPKRSHSRTLYSKKGSDSATLKGSDSHTYNGRSDAVSDVGISEGKDWQGSGWRTNWLAGTEYENSDA
jgi:hypothetical protein